MKIVDYDKYAIVENELISSDYENTLNQIELYLFEDDNSFMMACSSIRQNLQRRLNRNISLEQRKKDVQTALDNNSNINFLNEFGITPLILSCINQDIEIIQFLLDNGADVNLCSNEIGRSLNKHNKNTALMVACANGNIEIVKLLLSNGADINLTNTKDNTALKIASAQGNIDIVQLLIDNGAEINFLYHEHFLMRNNNANTALINACIYKHTDIVKLLLKEKAKTDIFAKYSALTHSCFDNNLIIVNILVNKKIEMHQTLFEVCKNTYTITTIDKALSKIEKKANNDRKEIIKLLLSSEYFTFEKRDMDSFKYAYDNNDEEIVKFFIENGGDVNALYDDEITFLYHAKSRPSKKWFLKLIGNQTPHNPKELSNILKQFSNNEKLKFSNHPWGTTQILSEELNYENFLKYLKKGWEEIESELKIYAPQLHKDIYSFLFDNITEEKYLFGKSITCGWSSDKVKNANLIGASENNKPENLEGFEKMINIFKNSFVIKQNDKNSRFLKRFMEIRKKLSRDNKFTAEIDLNGLKIEQDFKIFTDVPKLEQAIISILEEINDMGENQKVKVSFKEEELSKIEKTVLLMITHIDSTSKKSAEELEKNIEKNGGRFKDIYNNLLSVCDWSIDTICKDGVRYKIDYLYPTIDNDKPHITHILEKNEGFTYILRLYI